MLHTAISRYQSLKWYKKINIPISVFIGTVNTQENHRTMETHHHKTNKNTTKNKPFLAKNVRFRKEIGKNV